MRRVMRSSRREKWAMTSVNRGTVAFRMEATAESMERSPQEMRKMGIARLVGPRSAKAPQVLRSRGQATLRCQAMPAAARAPKSMR